jgi:hypothetical protein
VSCQSRCRRAAMLQDFEGNSGRDLYYTGGVMSSRCRGFYLYLMPSLNRHGIERTTIPYTGSHPEIFLLALQTSVFVLSLLSCCLGNLPPLHLLGTTLTSQLTFLAVSASKMALPGYCNHSFNLLKSESTLIQWVCSMCHSGPHWYIFECKDCKLKTCRPCTNKV